MKIYIFRAFGSAMAVRASNPDEATHLVMLEWQINDFNKIRGCLFQEYEIHDHAAYLGDWLE